MVPMSGLLAHAQIALNPLSGGEIAQYLFGRTVTGEYDSGKAWAERFNRDGTSEYSEDGILRRGRMTLRGNRLCFEYGQIDGLVGGCFEVWKRGQNCFDFYGVGDGTLSATLNQKRFGEAWSARAWYSDEPSTCTTAQIS